MVRPREIPPEAHGEMSAYRCNRFAEYCQIMYAAAPDHGPRFMLLPPPIHYTLRLCAVATTAVAFPARSETHEVQGWLTEAFTFKADKSTTVTIDLNQRARRQGSDDEQFLQRVTVEHGIAPGLRIGSGMLYAFSDTERELRPHQQITYTKGIFETRTRLEQRFFEGAPRTGWRLRQRMQLLVPIDTGKRWNVVAAGEVMFHLNRARDNDTKGFAVLRNEIGLRHKVSKHLDVQLSYMRQQSIRENRADQIVHLPWLRFNFFL